ncbi:Uncharacterised protein [Enterobacter cloacae]|nr:Uncharacterised protein [Enterobacter cloacae]
MSIVKKISMRSLFAVFLFKPNLRRRASYSILSRVT